MSGRSSAGGGFTLLEIMLAMLILGMVVAMVSVSLSGSIKVVEGTMEQGDIHHRAQVALERISEDLTSAVLPKDVEFSGGLSENGGGQRILLSFATLAHLVLDPSQEQSGMGIVSYAVQPDKDDPRQLMLLRADVLHRPLKEGMAGEEAEAFLLCDRLRQVKFAFLDRNGEALDSWDTAAGPDDPEKKRRLPCAVSCRLEFWLDVEQGTTLSFETTMTLPVGLIQPGDKDDAV